MAAVLAGSSVVATILVVPAVAIVGAVIVTPGLDASVVALGPS